MHKLNELAAKLPAAQVKEVEHFAEFLISRLRPESAGGAAKRPHKISFEGWAGCLEHVHPELSDKEFMRVIEDERAREAME